MKAHIAEAARKSEERVRGILEEAHAEEQGGIVKCVHLACGAGADAAGMWTEALPAELPELAAVNRELISGQTMPPPACTLSDTRFA